MRQRMVIFVIFSFNFKLTKLELKKKYFKNKKERRLSHRTTDDNKTTGYRNHLLE